MGKPPIKFLTTTLVLMGVGCGIGTAGVAQLSSGPSDILSPVAPTMPAVVSNPCSTPKPPPAPALAAPPQGPPLVTASSTFVHYSGRFDTTRAAAGDGVLFSCPACGVSANFQGTSLSVTLGEATPGAASGNDPNEHNRYYATVDGNAPVLISTINPGPTAYMVAPQLHPGAHQVTVTRLADGSTGIGIFYSLETSQNGNFLSAPSFPKRRLEFFGASELTGYGLDFSNDPQGCANLGDAIYDANHSLSVITGALLQAESINIAYSGKGIIHNYESATSTNNTLPVIYGRAVSDDPTPLYDPNDPIYGPSGWHADAVIIDCGGVDFIFGTPDPDAFEAGLLSIVGQARTFYPKALIVLVVDPQAPDVDRPIVETDFNAVLSQVQAGGDNNVQVLIFPPYDSVDDGIGCGNHPTYAGEQRTASELTVFLKAQLGW